MFRSPYTGHRAGLRLGTGPALLKYSVAHRTARRRGPTGVRALKGREDLDFAVLLTHYEHWYYTHLEIGRMLELDPEGSFVYEDGGARLGFITTVSFGRTGVVGHLIVSKDSRGRKIGETLLEAALEHLESKSPDSIILYSSGDGQRLYARHGFRVVEPALVLHTRMEGAQVGRLGSRCEPIEHRDLAEVIELDSGLFGDDRGSIIRVLYEAYPEGAFKIARDGRIEGFVMGRPDHVGFDLGPWAYVGDDPSGAEALFDSILPALGPGTLYACTFPRNTHAVSILSRLPQTLKLEVPLMVKGEARYVGSSNVYAVAGTELG